jgi:phytoene dehydrogenase-like protein
VVGAGIAGLAIALGCERGGHEVTLFEAKNSIGGRMETIEHDGHPLDVGFHVLHTAYPTVQRWINLEQLNVKAMDNCTVTIHPESGRRRLLGDALRSPRYLLPTVRSVGIRDGVRFLRWKLNTSSSDLERGLDTPSRPIAATLHERRFRPSTRRVLETLFTGITLDPTLSERFAFADFTWGAMAHGSMVVPQQGIGAVPQQLASRLSTTSLRLGETVTNVTANGLSLGGEALTFDKVVLAVPQHVAANLLPSMPSTHQSTERLTSTVVFKAPRPPFRRARLLLNESWGQNGNIVLHVHVPTNLHPHSKGEHWIVATLVGQDALEPNIQQVRTELRGWFGSQVEQWEFSTTTMVRHALPHIDPQHHARAYSELEIDGVLVAGDHRAHPSVQGALSSAEQILKHLGVPLPTEANA